MVIAPPQRRPVVAGWWLIIADPRAAMIFDPLAMASPQRRAAREPWLETLLRRTLAMNCQASELRTRARDPPAKRQCETVRTRHPQPVAVLWIPLDSLDRK